MTMGRSDITLVRPDESWRAEVEAFRREFVERDERVSGGVGLERADDYDRWLAGDYPPHYGRVEEAVFLAVRADRTVVGISDVRLGSNDFIEHFAGQLGYSVRPGERGRGYANEILRLTLLEARRLGFKRILVTCNDPNVASAKTIERNGGVLEAVVPHPGYPDVRRYWVDLTSA